MAVLSKILHDRNTDPQFVDELRSLLTAEGLNDDQQVVLRETWRDIERALKIPRASACGVANEWFYVEARQAKGYDAFLAGNANVLSGVLVHKVTDGVADSSYLLDMTPSTSAWSDAALTAGKSFTDPQSGLRISTLSAGSTGARVSVTFPPASCTRAAPAVTITPGETIWTPAGASVNYTVEAQNRDSCGCAPTNFDVSATVPSGWGATNARTPSVVAGGSAVASILVTTPVAVPAGFYPLTLKAANVAALAMAGSATGTVAIDATATPPPPVADAGVPTMDVVASTDKSSYRRPRYGSVSAMITTTGTIAQYERRVSSSRAQVRSIACIASA